MKIPDTPENEWRWFGPLSPDVCEPDGCEDCLAAGGCLWGLAPEESDE